MAAKVLYRLKHMHMQGDWIEYLHDGKLEVHDAIVEVPSDKPYWLTAVWSRGFACDPETGRMYGELIAVPQVADEPEQESEPDTDAEVERAENEGLPPVDETPAEDEKSEPAPEVKDEPKPRKRSKKAEDTDAAEQGESA